MASGPPPETTVRKRRQELAVVQAHRSIQRGRGNRRQQANGCMFPSVEMARRRDGELEGQAQVAQAALTPD